MDTCTPITLCLSSLSPDLEARLLDETKAFIVRLGSQKKVNFRTVYGFKVILPDIKTSTARKWRSVGVRGDISFLSFLGSIPCSLSNAVLFLVYSGDVDLKEIRENKLEAYDFVQAPRSYWVNNKKMPSQNARRATRHFLEVLAGELQVRRFFSVSGFRILLPYLTYARFRDSPLNVWGTTLSGMLATAYSNSPFLAVKDLVDRDRSFSQVKRVGLYPEDFARSPKNYWVDKGGKPTPHARNASLRLIVAICKAHGLSYNSVDGFKAAIGLISPTMFRSFPINVWGTTVGSMLLYAYHNRIEEAMVDVVDKHSAFAHMRSYILPELKKG